MLVACVAHTVRRGWHLVLGFDPDALIVEHHDPVDAGSVLAASVAILAML